jgi:hypothetical protein
MCRAYRQWLLSPTSLSGQRTTVGLPIDWSNPTGSAHGAMVVPEDSKPPLRRVGGVQVAEADVDVELLELEEVELKVVDGKVVNEDGGLDDDGIGVDGISVAETEVESVLKTVELGLGGVTVG